MRAVVQRVREADVTVDGSVTGAIERGLMVLLGVEDGDDESCSITNQRRLLNRFKEEHSEFHDYQVEEFIDDGYTGSNFNRPNFQNMMSRVRSLYGNMIVIATKDFSRLGRDTIDTVNYLEKIFPCLLYTSRCV